MGERRIDYGFPRERDREFPAMVVASITNVCNLKCVHCFSKDYMKLPGYVPTFLDFDLYRRFVDEIGEHPGTILNFGTDGEPLLHPRFLDMLRHARARNVAPITLTTNGVNLREPIARALLEERLMDVLNVSVDAFTAAGYARVRGPYFDKVIANLERLLELRAAGAHPMKVMVNMIDQDEVRHEVEDFRRHWSPRVDKVIIRTYYSCHGLVERSKEHFEQVGRWPCFQLWNRFNVTHEGLARFCVDDWFDKSAIGDLRTQTIAEIWRGPEYERLRALMLAGRYDEIPYCAGCTEWQGMPWDFNYITAMDELLGEDSRERG